MKETVIIPIILSFAVSAILGPVIIPILRRIKAGQTERDDGPQSHLKKSGTPTMGGFIILISVILTSLLFVKDYPKILPILFMTIGYGTIGFLDDYIKVVLKRSLGLRAWQKALLQFFIAAIFTAYLYMTDGYSLAMKVPFMPGFTLDLGWVNIPITLFIILGTVNGSNFTDGIDGLESSVTVMIAIFFSAVAIGTASGIEPITCAVVGALMGFLLFNVHPAAVFMGDMGSLALGGFVISTAYMLNMQLFIPIVALIYFVEVLSVILQVGYFKLTKGKRIFRMAPIHHHFELCGWSETRVVAVFTIVTVILCLVGFLAI